MHITVAIPTFNRVEQLKKCLESITTQSLDSDIQLSIAISNTASSDGTYSYLSNLEGTDGRYFITNQLGTDTQCNMGSLAATIPPNTDWVWLMGDDDCLESNRSIAIVHDLIKTSENLDLSFVHACQARRSAQSGNVYKEETLKLCEEFGYHEMLGWISSIVTRRNILITALTNVQNSFRERPLKVSSYAHSAELLKLLHDKQGAFIDFPLVEPQDNEQTEDSIERWRVENMGERYFYVVDDLIEMQRQGLLKNSLPATFFRYHRYNLWDRLIAHQLGELVNAKNLADDDQLQTFVNRFVENWGRIDKLCKMIEEQQVQKYLSIMLHHAIMLSSQFLHGKLSRSEFEDAAIQHVKLLNSPIYEFNVLQNHGDLCSAA